MVVSEELGGGYTLIGIGRTNPYIRSFVGCLNPAGAKQPIHSFLGGKGLRHPIRNECMG